MLLLRPPARGRGRGGAEAENPDPPRRAVSMPAVPPATYRRRENGFEKFRHLDISVHFKLILITIIYNSQLLS